MMKYITNYIRKLVEDKKDLTLLQVVYLVLVILSVIICGLVGLMNQSLGVGMLIFPLVVAVALCMNTVSWALIKLGVESSGIKRKPAVAKKTAKKTAVSKSKKK